MRKVFGAGAAGALLALVLVTPASAQSVQGGIKGGASFSTLDGLREVLSDVSGVDIDQRTNWVFGGFVKINMGSFFAIQPEVLYVRKGAKAAATGLFTESVKFNLDYIDIPVLLRLQTGSASGFYVVGGPSFGINVAAESESGSETEDISEDIENDTGIVLGAGFDLAHFLVEGRYTQSLTSITESPVPSVKHRAVSVLFGIRF
jgi:hypothetical protein